MKSFDDNVLIPVRSFMDNYSHLLGNTVFPANIREAESAMNFSGKADMDKILQDEMTVVQLVERFHLEDMYDKPGNFVSMLYYIGMLTIKEGILNKTVLGVPNYVIRKIYWEYFTLKRCRNNLQKLR